MADHSSFYSGALGVVNDEFSEQPGTRLTFVHAKLRALAYILTGHWGNKRYISSYSSLPLPPSFPPSLPLSLSFLLNKYVYVRDEFGKEMV